MNKNNEIPTIVDENKNIEDKINNQFISTLDYQNYNQNLTTLSNNLSSDLSDQELVFILNEVHNKIKALDTKLDREVLMILRKIENGNLTPADIQIEINILQSNISNAQTEIWNITSAYNTDKATIQTRASEFLVHQKNLTEMSDSELDNYLLSLNQGIQHQKEAILTKADELKKDDAEYWDDWFWNDADYMEHKNDIDMAEEMMHDAVLKTVNELTKFAADTNSLKFSLSTIDPSLGNETWEFANQADKLLYVKQTLDTLNSWLNEHDSQWIAGTILWWGSLAVLVAWFFGIKAIFKRLPWVWLIWKGVSKLYSVASRKKADWKNTSAENSAPESEKSTAWEKVTEINEKLSKEKMLDYIEKVEKKVSWDVDKMRNLFSLKKLVSAWNLNWFPESSFWEILYKIENWTLDVNFWKKTRIKLADWTLTKRPINWWKELIKWDINQLSSLNYLKEFDTPETKVTLLWEEYKIPEKYKAEIEELAKQLDDMDRISKIEADIKNIKEPELTKTKANLTKEKTKNTKAINELAKTPGTIPNPSWKWKDLPNPKIQALQDVIKESSSNIKELEKTRTTLEVDINKSTIEIDRLSDIKANIDDQFDDIFRKKWTTPTISKLSDVEIRKIDTRRKFIQSLIKAIK